MGLTEQAMADSEHLHLIASAGMEVLDNQPWISRFHRTHLAGIVAIVSDFVFVLTWIHITFPANIESFLDRFPVLDDRRRWSSDHIHCRFIRFHFLGYCLHSKRIIASGQQRFQYIIGLICVHRACVAVECFHFMVTDFIFFLEAIAVRFPWNGYETSSIAGERTQILHWQRLQRNIDGYRPRGDLARHSFHHNLIGFARLQVLANVQPGRALRGTRYGLLAPRRGWHLVFIEFAESFWRLPHHPEAIGRYWIGIVCNVDRLQWHCTVLSGRRERNFVFRHCLHWYIVGSTGDEAFEGGLCWTWRLALFLHIQHTFQRIWRLNWYFVMRVNASWVWRLPQHQQCCLIAEPDDKFSGRIRFWFYFQWSGRELKIETRD